MRPFLYSNRLRILILFITIFSSVIFYGQSQFVAKKKRQKGVFRLLTYGLPDSKTSKARAVVEDRWGIEFYWIAGCFVSDSQIDSAQRINKRTDRRIIAQYGKNWREAFYKEVETEKEIQEKVTGLLDKFSYIIEKKEKIEADGGFPLEYELKAIPNSNRYMVFARSWRMVQEKSEILFYCKLTVDYKTNIVTLLSD